MPCLACGEKLCASWVGNGPGGHWPGGGHLASPDSHSRFEPAPVFEILAAWHSARHDDGVLGALFVRAAGFPQPHFVPGIYAGCACCAVFTEPPSPLGVTTRDQTGGNAN